MKAFTTIALDGAAASGKTTTAKIIAKKYDFMRISTGEYYRAVAHALLQAKISVDDEQAIAQKLNGLTLGSSINGNKGIMLINGQAVPDEILRSTEINTNVARFAQVQCIRKFLLQYQRDQLNTAKQHAFHGLVAEGRDIGSVVFPDADLRFFLYADLQKREQRRNRDNENDCISCRDSIDTNITTMPKNVIMIDTGKNSVQQVEAIISQYIEELY